MDVNHFQDLISSYTQHKHAASEVCSRCLEPLGEALALVKGDFLAGFSLTDSSSFDDWQAEQTDALRNDFSRVLQKLIIINLNDSTQEAQETMRYARRWLSLDPLHEPAHRLLMGLYASNNQSSAATKQYQDCVDVLSKELNIEPEQETVSLFKRIRQGSFDAANDLETLPFNFIAASPNKTPGSNNLPVQIMPFIGRDFELTALTGLLNDSQFSMVSIVAPGGMGKTRLALELGKKMLPHFKDGVFLVELAPISEGTTIIPAIAEATGYQFQSDGGNQKQQLLAYLANKWFKSRE